MTEPPPSGLPWITGSYAVVTSVSDPDAGTCRTRRGIGLIWINAFPPPIIDLPAECAHGKGR